MKNSNTKNAIILKVINGNLKVDSRLSIPKKAVPKVIGHTPGGSTYVLLKRRNLVVDSLKDYLLRGVLEKGYDTNKELIINAFFAKYTEIWVTEDCIGTTMGYGTNSESTFSLSEDLIDYERMSKLNLTKSHQDTELETDDTTITDFLRSSFKNRHEYKSIATNTIPNSAENISTPMSVQSDLSKPLEKINSFGRNVSTDNNTIRKHTGIPRIDDRPLKTSTDTLFSGAMVLMGYDMIDGVITHVGVHHPKAQLWYIEDVDEKISSNKHVKKFIEIAQDLHYIETGMKNDNGFVFSYVFIQYVIKQHPELASIKFRRIS